MIKILIWTVCIGSIYCQLTSILLDPPTVTIPERQVGNVNLTEVRVVPVGTIVNCDIIQVDSLPLISILTHPFQRSFETLGPSNVQWYVYFDGGSPNKLDFDVYPSYQVTVECSGVTGTASAILAISVIENRAPVVVNAPIVSQSRSAPSVFKGELLYPVTANDPDGEPLTYDFQIVPPVNYFDINPVTHEIRAAVDFLSVAQSPIDITVTVSDGDKSDQLVVNFVITNTNIRPEITNLPKSITVPENSPGGMELILLLYLDPDQTQPFTPTCTVTPNTQAPVFSVIGSRIYLATGADGASLLDFETTPSYQLSCLVFDQFLYSDGTDILTVTVIDVNEGPVFNQQMYVCNVQESQALVSECVLGLNVQDPEGDLFTISILPSADSPNFQFTSSAGDKLTFAVDYDIDNNAMPQNVLLTIEAKDNSGQTSTAQIQVSVLDKNDNSPVFAPQQVIDLTPTTLVGTVGNVVVTDADSGVNSDIEYTLTSVDPSTTSPYISVLPTGQIHYVKKFPNSLKDSTALLNIRASDKGTPPRATTGLVTVRFLGDTTSSIIPQPTNGNLGSGQAAAVADKTFFDEPANIAIVAVLGVVLLILLLVAFFFCIKKMLLGYCCGPRKPSNVYPSSDDYRLQNDYNRRRFNSGYPRNEDNHPDIVRDYTSYSHFNRGKSFHSGPPSSVKDFYDDRSIRGNPY